MVGQMFMSKPYVPSPYEELSRYLHANYPAVTYTFIADGLFIHERATVQWAEGPPACFRGLIIKYKPPGTRLFKRDGRPYNDAIREQALSLDEWALKGYMALFAVGTYECKQLISGYLEGWDPSQPVYV